MLKGQHVYLVKFRNAAPAVYENKDDAIKAMDENNGATFEQLVAQDELECTEEYSKWDGLWYRSVDDGARISEVIIR